MTAPYRFATAAAAAVFALLLAATPAFAKGDVAAGEKKAQPCQACHGPTGNGIDKDGKPLDAQYPLIAGQYADYIVKALHDYKSGSRDNAIMTGFVQTLSDEDIEDLAAFYEAQDGTLKDISHLK